MIIHPPRKGIRGPVFLAWFGVFFVLVATGTLIFGFVLAGGVRKTAALTDNAVRTVAWNVLRYAAAHDGRFPTSESEFLEGSRNGVDPPPSATKAWPTDEKTALLGHHASPLPQALGEITVHWPVESWVAPEIQPKGKPTLPGTLDAVRGWLHAWVDAHPKSAAPRP
ncbi:MAG: hypothetical protein U0574_11375 [Phycisphaerales bacterium]